MRGVRCRLYHTCKWVRQRPNETINKTRSGQGCLNPDRYDFAN
jgi:hypothetical protein